MVTLSNRRNRKIIRELLEDNGNHRKLVLDAINRSFLEMALAFFGEVANAKLKGLDVRADDWYVEEVLRKAPKSSGNKEHSLRGGLAGKTVKNLYGSQRLGIVIDASEDNLASLRGVIDELLTSGGPEIVLTIKMNGIGIDLTVSESLVVVNVIAVMRHSMSGAYWAQVGNDIQAPLMETLCVLCQVDKRHYRESKPDDGEFEVDFVLVGDKDYRSEVKLNGPGNPESVTIAPGRGADLVVADWVSEQNANSLDDKGICWVDLHTPDRFERFSAALQKFNIPHHTPSNLNALDQILDTILPLP